MHEFALQVQEGEMAVHRQGRREFHYAHQHQGSHLTRGAGHRQDQAGHHGRTGHGQHHLPQGLDLGRAQGQRTFPQGPGNAAQALFGGDDDHRQRKDGEGQGGPEDAGRTEGRRRIRLGKEQGVDVAAEEIHEKTQAEHAVDDGGHARQIVDGDPDGAHQRALLGVLAQIQGRDHAEGRDDHGHQQDHHHRAENGGKHAALGIGFARLVADEFPDLGEIVAQLVDHAHRIRLEGNDDLGQIDFPLTAILNFQDDAVAFTLPAQRDQLFVQLFVCLAQGPPFVLDFPVRPRIVLGGNLF